jgi:glycosyltransferase involved in cell wall biosynthesis
MTANAPPLVTIGLPLYNTAKIMEASLQDLLGQTFTDFELVISDNASSDETGSMCQALAERDPRVRYFRQETNVGIVENQNAVFRLARGKYFKWASANDRCDKQLLAECVNVLEQHSDVVLCFPRTRIIDSDDQVVRDCEEDLHLMDGAASSRFVKLLDRMALNNAFNGVFRADILKCALPMAPDLGSDLSMMAALTLYGKFYELPEFLFQRRIDRDSHTAERMRQNDAETDDYLYGSTGGRSMQDFRTLKSFHRLFRAGRRAPLSWREKIHLCGILAHRLFWMRRELPREIYDGLARKSRLVPAPRGPNVS